MVDAGFETQSPVSLWWSADGITMIPVSTANPLPTTGGGGGGGGGAITAPIGQTTDAASVAVTLSTDQTDVVSGTEAVKIVIINPADGTYLTYTTPTNVVGPTAVGTAAANPPILVAGTADATATGTVQVLKVSSGGVVSANTAQVNGVTTLTGTGATGTGSQRVTVAVDSATVAGSASLPAGTNVIGHVIADSGSTTAVTGTVTVAGVVASGTAVSGNPLLSGARAATTIPTAVSDGAAVALMASKDGKLVTADGGGRELRKNQNTIITASTSETTIVTAGASGVFNDLYGLILANTGSTTTKVDIRDATGGSIIMTIEVPTLDTRGFMLSGGSATPQTIAANNWTAQCGSSTSSLQVTAFYIQAK